MLGELAGYINSAGTQLAEARQNLALAQDSLEGAKGAIAEAMGDASSETLQDYMAFVNRAIAEVQDAIGQIDAGHDKGQEFIGRLAGM